MAGQSGVHRFAEYDRTAAAGVLGLVHGDVGVPYYLLCATFAFEAGDDSDAGHRMDLVAKDVVTGSECIQQPLGDLDRLAGLVNPVDQDQELIPAETTDDIRIHVGRAEGTQSEGGLQTARDLTQQLIARLMTQCVVHQLEAVEIEKQHGTTVLLPVADPDENVN